jgi:polyisoprenoid-binding protein YceI
MGPMTEASVLYVNDARASQFTVQVFAGGVLSAFGHSPTIAIRDFSAEIQLNPAEVRHSSVKLTIKAGSLSVRDDISDKDRREIEGTMQRDVLETSSYPEIIYDCSNLYATSSGDGQYSVTLNGDLTLHGVTRAQPVSLRVHSTEDTLRAFGNFTILQTDYQIQPVTIAGGVLKVKDELKFSFNILARRKQ